MNRRLIIMRHAKSSWTSGVSTDHRRPLNPRGQRDAPKVGARLVELGWTPQIVLSSDSLRTRETYQLMSEAFPQEVPCEFLNSLYHGGATEASAELSRLDDDVQSALLLGHNPGWEGVIERLTGVRVVMKTSSAALLEGTGETWREAVGSAPAWKLSELIRAREL